MNSAGQGRPGDPYGWPEGYLPQPYMGQFKCERCGCIKFETYAQTVPADRNRPWTYEYQCKKCGHTMGLTLEP